MGIYNERLGFSKFNGAFVDRIKAAAKQDANLNALVLLFTVHFALMYGFMSYCLGLPILLWLLARLAALDPQDPVRRDIRDALVTMHLPIKDVSKNITQDRVLTTIRTTQPVGIPSQSIRVKRPR